MPRQFVEHLRNGQSVDEIYLLSEKQLRANRNGDLFLLVHLKDRTGVVHGLMWNVTEELAAGFDTGDYVRVEGKVQMYQGALQTILTRVNQVGSNSIETSDFEEDRSEAAERQLSLINELLRGLRNEDLRDLMSCFLDDEPLVAAFSRAVAGVKIHHAFRGGLLEHVTTLLEAAEGIAALYPFLNRDLLLAGVFLHDLGKVREISVEGTLTYTDEGQLLGHIVLVLEDLEKKVSEFAERTGREFDRELLMQLKHLVVSHHGSLETGSPRVPMTPEAIALHHLDNLDAKVNEAMDVINSDPNRHSAWTAYVPRLGRKFYKGRDETSVDPLPGNSEA
jgi:3'-5' exoribonuclease